MQRPEKTEYNEYYGRYISLVDETEIVAAFENQLREMSELFNIDFRREKCVCLRGRKMDDQGNGRASD